MSKKEMDFTVEFLNFLRECGFKPSSCLKILEIMQEVSTSMSIYLKENNNAYLLSPNVKYQELLRKGIKGDRGNLTCDGFSISNTLNLRSLYIKGLEEKGIVVTEEYPLSSEFDTMIGYHTSFDAKIKETLSKLVFYNSIYKYIGFVVKSDNSELRQYVNYYLSLLKVWNETGKISYKLMYKSCGKYNFYAIVPKKVKKVNTLARKK